MNRAIAYHRAKTESARLERTLFGDGKKDLGRGVCIDSQSPNTLCTTSMIYGDLTALLRNLAALDPNQEHVLHVGNGGT